MDERGVKREDLVIGISASGRAAPEARAPWPKVTSYPSLAELGVALGEPLGSRILLLDPGEPQGFVCDWHPPGLAPLRHFSYAIQWWIFASLALLGWALLSVHRTGGANG